MKPSISFGSMQSSLQKLPLYDLLAKTSSEKSPEIVKLGKILDELSPKQATQVALLIIHYYFSTSSSGGYNPFVRSKNTGKTLDSLPYAIKMNNESGFSFDLGSLPQDLKLVLWNYCGSGKSAD